jgi:hypothetical protein
MGKKSNCVTVRCLSTLGQVQKGDLGHHLPPSTVKQEEHRGIRSHCACSLLIVL